MYFKEVNPKALLILDEIKAQSIKWEKDYDPDDDVKIITIEELKNLPYNFGKNRPKIGQIYIQHPFQENFYVTPELDPHELQRIKLNNISQLYAILGAKRFKSIIVNKKESLKERDIEINVSHPVASGQIGASDSLGNILSHYYEVIHNYGGCEPNLEKAKEFLLSSGLVNDNSISQMINRRNAYYENPATSEYLKVNMSHEIQKSFDFGAKLKAMAGKFNLGVKYSSKEVSREIVELEIFIEY